MNYEQAIKRLDERSITWSVDEDTDLLSFYTDVDGEQVKLWTLDEYDNALNDFCVDNNEHIEEIIVRFCDRPMLIDYDCMDSLHYDCPTCDEWGDENEKEREMWSKYYKSQIEGDYGERYDDLMSSTGGL